MFPQTLFTFNASLYTFQTFPKRIICSSSKFTDKLRFILNFNIALSVSKNGSIFIMWWVFIIHIIIKNKRWLLIKSILGSFWFQSLWMLTCVKIIFWVFRFALYAWLIFTNIVWLMFFIDVVLLIHQLLLLFKRYLSSSLSNCTWEGSSNILK